MSGRSVSLPESGLSVSLPESWRRLDITLGERWRCSATVEGMLAYCVSGLRTVLQNEHYAALSEIKNNSTANVTRGQPPHIELICSSDTPAWPATLTPGNVAQCERMAEVVRTCKPFRLEWWGVGEEGPRVRTSVLVLVLARSDSDGAIGRLHITVVAARRARLAKHGPAAKVLETAKDNLGLIARYLPPPHPHKTNGVPM